MNTDGSDRKHRRRLVAAAVGLGLVGTAGVLALTGHHTPSRTAPTPLSHETPVVSVPMPIGVRASFGPETPAGAAAVAAGIVGDEPLLVEGSTSSANALVASWATPTARPALQRAFQAARAGFVTANGGPFSFDTALLAERSAATGPGRATVDAWCAEVLFDHGTPALGVYVTEHLGLVWTDGRWLLGSITDTPGPSVALAGTPTPAAEAAATLDGFVPTAAATATTDDVAAGK